MVNPHLILEICVLGGWAMAEQGHNYARKDAYALLACLSSHHAMYSRLQLLVLISILGKTASAGVQAMAILGAAAGVSTAIPRG